MRLCMTALQQAQRTEEGIRSYFHVHGQIAAAQRAGDEISQTAC